MLETSFEIMTMTKKMIQRLAGIETNISGTDEPRLLSFPNSYLPATLHMYAKPVTEVRVAFVRSFTLTQTVQSIQETKIRKQNSLKFMFVFCFCYYYYSALVSASLDPL